MNNSSALRRTSASTTPPHLLERQMSMPVGPTSPQLGRAERNGMSFFDNSDGINGALSGRLVQTPRRQRNGIGYISGSGAMRPGSRDSSSGVGRDNSPAFNFPISLQRASTSSAALSTSSLESNTTADTSLAKSRLPRAGSQQRTGRQNPPAATAVRDSTRVAPTSSSRAAAPKVPRESLYGVRNGGVDITVASARRTAARRNLNGEGKWS